jgi:hypothetical protein
MNESEVTVRQAAPADAEALAALRWEWGHDALPAAGDPQWAGYRKQLAGWMTEHGKTHIAFLAEHGASATWKSGCTNDIHL